MTCPEEFAITWPQAVVCLGICATISIAVWSFFRAVRG